MFKKIKNWLKEYKYDLLFGWSCFATGLAIVFLIGTLTFMAISNDLVGRVEKEIKTQDELKSELEVARSEASYYYYMADELKQTYEDVIPKQQYIDDIEYLESVILELRTQCEQECSKCD